MPISELGEVLNQTQTALAGWWKVLDVLDKEIEVKEPSKGLTLPESPLDVKLEEVDFSYRTGGLVLNNINVYILVKFQHRGRKNQDESIKNEF